MVIAWASAIALLVAGVSLHLIVPASTTRADDVSSQIDSRVDQLGIQSVGAIDPMLDKALQVSRAIADEDFATAHRIIAAVLEASQLQNWRFYPYDDFIADVFAVAPPDFGRHLDAWVAQDGTDATPLLLRAKYHYDTGWTKRGHGFVNQTSQEQLAAFVDDLRAAFADVSAALALDQRNPYGYFLRLNILSGEGASPAVIDAFNDAKERFPGYYRPYDLMLQMLQPRWGGSIPAMSAFVDEAAGKAPPFSPLKLLYLSLYRYLLSTGSTTCAMSGNDNDQMAQCTIAFMNAQVPPGLEARMLDALGLYDHSDKFQFGLAIKEILSDMLATPGGDMHAGAVLQLAATSMHSDTQLKQANPGHNDYVVDELLASSWAMKGFYDNAVTKYNDALADVRNGSFAGEDDRNAALGRIYVALSEAAARQGQFADEIAYEKAAVLVGWAWDEDRICRAYYQLKQYDQVIQACTDALSHTNNSHAWYWRGEAHDKSGHQDLALADLKQSVAMDDDFSPYAVVDMSMIYFGRGDNQSALDVLNSYPPLYDPSRTAKSQVAVAYNNRCYAYMQLGDLKKALDDCTQSLRYGSIPEAIRKQQELLARLSPSGKAS